MSCNGSGCSTETCWTDWAETCGTADGKPGSFMLGAGSKSPPWCNIMLSLERTMFSSVWGCSATLWGILGWAPGGTVLYGTASHSSCDEGSKSLKCDMTSPSAGESGKAPAWRFPRCSDMPSMGACGWCLLPKKFRLDTWASSWKLSFCPFCTAKESACTGCCSDGSISLWCNTLSLSALRTGKAPGWRFPWNSDMPSIEACGWPLSKKFWCETWASSR